MINKLFFHVFSLQKNDNYAKMNTYGLYAAIWLVELVLRCLDVVPGVIVGCVEDVEVEAEAYLNLNSFNFLHYTRIVILYLFFLFRKYRVLSVLSRKYLFI